MSRSTMGANYMSHNLFGDSLTAPHFSELFCVTGMTLLRYKISDGKDDPEVEVREAHLRKSSSTILV